MVVLMAPFDYSLLYFIKKELSYGNITRIEIVAYDYVDLSVLESSLGREVRRVTVSEGFEEVLMNIVEHVGKSKSSYHVLFTEYSPIELVLALISSFALVKKNASFVIYIGERRTVVDANLFAFSKLDNKDLLILKAISEGRMKVKDIAQFSETSNSTVSRVKNRLKEEGYIRDSNGKYELTLKGRVALRLLELFNHKFQKVEKVKVVS